MDIAAAFGRARDYDVHADVQRTVATRLAARILMMPVDRNAHVLEIGCGTGFLGGTLLKTLPTLRYVMTDLAPAMVARAQAQIGPTANVRFVAMDGASPSEPGPFDLICSSLAMQWIEDLPAAVAGLRRLLAPSGRLAFTTLAAGSFAEWRAAYGVETPGTPDYPTITALGAAGLDVSTDRLTCTHPDARAFLRALKGIGAGTPHRDYRPLPPAGLREVMARFEASGAQATYVIATCIAGPWEGSA